MNLSFVPVLHGLRGMAAMGVLLFHWSQFFPAMNAALAAMRWGPEAWMNLSLPLALGWQGVPLFFVLSAFLLTAQWMGRPLTGATLSHFWKRRFLRIYPAHWLQLAILLLVVMWLPALWRPFGASDVWLNLLLWVNLPPAMNAPLNPVWWTLPIELSFYLLLPGLILLQRRIGWVWVFAICVATSILWRTAVMWQFSGENLAARLPVLDAIPGTLATFGAGFALAFLLHARESTGGRRPLLLAVLLWLALQYWLMDNVDAYWNGHWMMAIWSPLLGLAIATGVYAVLQPMRGLRFLGSRPMVWLGDLSYGIYLWHFPVQYAMRLLWPEAFGTPITSLLALVLSTAVTLALAAMSYYGVERPLMGWGRHKT
jgi:peptidoglycan/LPS O-acetylase OafA/YrhL